MASRLNPDSADFATRRRAMDGPTRVSRAAKADDFFDADDNEAATTPKPTKVAREPSAESERDRKLAEMKVASADLARLGYRAEDIAQILAGNWKAPTSETASGTVPKVSGPVYEGFTLRSVAGKVLERLKGK